MCNMWTAFCKSQGWLVLNLIIHSAIFVSLIATDNIHHVLHVDRPQRSCQLLRVLFSANLIVFLFVVNTAIGATFNEKMLPIIFSIDVVRQFLNVKQPIWSICGPAIENNVSNIQRSVDGYKFDRLSKN